jgi:hypothetical protein
MPRKLEHLERLVEREMGLLTRLPTARPSAELVARIKAAVQAEATRVSHPVAKSLALPRWAAIAAALFLAVALSGVFSGALRSGEQPVDAAELLALWGDAVDHSNDRLSFLLDEGWMLEGAGSENGQPMDEFLDSLDATFEQLGTL